MINMHLMEATDLRNATQELANRIASARVLVNRLEKDARLRAGSNDSSSVASDNSSISRDQLSAVNSVIGRITSGLEMRSLAVLGSEDIGRLSIFEQVLSNYVRPGRYAGLALQLAESRDDVVDALVADSVESSSNRFYLTSSARSDDGTRMPVYCAGRPSNRGVLLVLPCGMPIALAERWMEILSEEFFVLAWESRGLFEIDSLFDSRPFSVAAQVEDLIAVMNHFEVREAHVMGLCGGAIIAATAASMRPDRIRSLSLWHGDYELGDRCPKTVHQSNLRALLAMAAVDRSAAAALHRFFSESAPPPVKRDYAHLVLYPYSNVELLFRYARLNGEIMSTDINPVVKHIVQPTLVVTSEDDATAHPAGSLFISEAMKNSTLKVFPHGDHLTLFEANEETVSLAREFLRATIGELERSEA